MKNTKLGKTLAVISAIFIELVLGNQYLIVSISLILPLGSVCHRKNNKISKLLNINFQHWRVIHCCSFGQSRSS